MSMFQSVLPTTPIEPVGDHLRNTTRHQSQYSILLSRGICPLIERTLALRFQVTPHTTSLRFNKFDALITDCRGRAIKAADKNARVDVAIRLALVDGYSYLPAEPCDQDIKLELITEAELNSDVLELRIASCFRTIQLEKQQSKQDRGDENVVTQDIIKENAYDILQTLIQHSTDWVVVKDLDHRFLLATNRFLQAHQKNASEVIGKDDLEIGTPEELVLGDESEEAEGYWSSDDKIIASRIPVESEQFIINESALGQDRERVVRVPIKNKDGEVIALFVCITQAHTLNINGDTISTFANRRNMDLSPNINKLDDDRNKAEAHNLKSQFTIKQKNNFIATASHDLRQPLHAIGLFVEALQKTVIDSKQQNILSKMKQSSHDLNDLLNSILDISKLDAEAVPVNNSHFAIAPLLKSIEDEFNTDASSKSIQLNINTSSSVVHTDSLLLSRILKNLVSNAVKFTTTGSVNLITEINEDHLTIRIKDTGPGIPKEQYQSIFLEYHQLQLQHEQPNFGQGLGLSIVKRLVELLKLDISLDSEMGRGTQFSLHVPLGNSMHANNIDQNTNDVEGSDSYRLLVVEDNVTVLEAMEEMLTSMNCVTYPAHDIPEALEIINELEELPNVLIVDYQLANGVTGDMAIEQIRAAAKKQIPAIIVTGNTSSALIREAAKSAYRVLSKPVNPDVLLRTINGAVAQRA